MSNGKKLAIVVGSVFAFIASAHAAEDSGWYVGAGLGQSQIDVNEGPFLQSDSDWSDTWTLTGGYRFNSWFALEAGYTDLGTARFHSDTSFPGVFDVSSWLKIDGFNAAAVGTLPIGSAFDVHARLGVFFSDTKLSIDFPDTGFSQTQSGSDQNLFYGAGIAWHANENWSLSLDYQRYTNVGVDDPDLDADVDSVGINAFFKF